MRKLLAVLFSVTVLTACHPPRPTNPVIRPGTGSFTFTVATLPDKPLKVWYYAPPVLAGAPILFVMHGTGRNGEGYRDAWVSEASKRGVILIVPEFSDALYPGSEEYNLGGVNVESPTRWAFAQIEPLFDYVRTDTGDWPNTYFLYGHSAGAQFVHRFLLFEPNNHASRSVAANAGWYTAVESTVDFPYGLKGAPTTPSPSSWLNQNLTILLGDQDTDPNDPDLRHDAGSDRQGLTRLARGQFFYATANNYIWPNNWQLTIVPGVSHSNVEMAPAAAQILFGIGSFSFD